MGARIARLGAERDQVEAALRDAEPETPSNHDELAALLADLPDLSEHLREADADADTKRLVFDAFDLRVAYDKVGGTVRVAVRLADGVADVLAGPVVQEDIAGGPLRPAAQPETRVCARSLTEGGLILAASAQHPPESGRLD